MPSRAQKALAARARAQQASAFAPGQELLDLAVTARLRKKAAARTAFVCVCGEFVYDDQREQHQCAGRPAPRSAPPPKESTENSEEKGEASDEELSESEEGREMRRLRTPNWDLKFGKRERLLIVLRRRNRTTGEIETLERPVLDDPDLPIHTYKFREGPFDYVFEFFM